MINNQDLYILGNIQYELQDWITVAIKLNSIDSLIINKDWTGFSEKRNEYMHFSLSVTLSTVKDDGSITQLAAWSSATFQKSYLEATSSDECKLLIISKRP